MEIEEESLKDVFQCRDSQDNITPKPCWNEDFLMHIDLFKCDISESMGQRRHEPRPLYRYCIKYYLDLFIKWRHFHSQIQRTFLILTLFHSIFPSCTVPATVRLSICGWEICRIICQKTHFKTLLFWNAGKVQHLIWNNCRLKIFSPTL